MDKTIIKTIIKKIKSYDTIIIHRHIRADGDAIGSSLGLREILRYSFPNKKIYSVGGELPEFLSFVGKEDIIEDSVYSNALVITVDSANSDRIQDERFKLAKEIIKIDHHIPVEDYGVINFVKENYGACALIIVEMASMFPKILKINSEAARYLYIAIMTDTGRFHFGVDKKALWLSGELLNYKFDIESIFANLYTKEKEAFKFDGWVYNNFKVSENGVAYIYISKDVKREYKISNDDASATVNKLDSIKGSMIWILFNEQDEETRVRIRSRYIPIDELAKRYSGGGHANAAGATVYSYEEAIKLVSEADEIMKKFKAENEDKF